MSIEIGLEQLFEALPMGVLVIDRHRRIRMANPSAAQLLGCAPGDLFGGFVNKDDVASVNRLLQEAGNTAVIRLDLAGGSKTVEVTAAIAGSVDHHALFVNDISEKVALGRQLKAARQPSRKLLYQLHATTTSMIGYTELIDLMLEEEPLVSGDRLNVIRRYHKEVRKSLETLGRLLKVEREGGRRPDASAIPLRRKLVVVIDNEAAVTEFISELMKGLQYRVASFSESREALAWCEAHCNSIDLVITDQAMRVDGKDGIAERLLSLPGAFPVVVCGNGAAPVPETSRTFVCHKPIDISELTQIVSDLL